MLSIENARFVSWYHVLDVNEGVLTSMNLECLKSLLDNITQILAFSLTVVNLIANIGILGLEQIHDWQNLPVVRNQSFTDVLTTSDQGLDNLQSY